MYGGFVFGRYLSWLVCCVLCWFCWLSGCGWDGCLGVVVWGLLVGLLSGDFVGACWLVILGVGCDLVGWLNSVWCTLCLFWFDCGGLYWLFGVVVGISVGCLADIACLLVVFGGLGGLFGCVIGFVLVGFACLVSRCFCCGFVCWG